MVMETPAIRGTERFEVHAPAEAAEASETVEASEATGPIAFVVAMESELRHLLDRVDLVEERRRGPWRDRIVRIGRRELVAVCSGIGMVNAAAATEHVLAEYRPPVVLNFGCAGAHRRDLLPGDVVVGAGTVYHGAVHILATGDEYFPDRAYTVTGETVAATELDADPAWLARVEASAAGWTPEPWPADLPWPDAIPRREPTVTSGIVASADIWTQFHERLDALHARHRSLCEDMEAAAVAQICRRHGVPSLSVKDISNNEYHVLSELTGDIEVLPASQIGKRSVALLLRMLERLDASL